MLAANPAGSFDYKKYAGKTVKLRLSKHSYVEALLPDLPSFQNQTGIKVEYDITPEEQYFDKLGLSQKSSDFDVAMLGAYMTWEYGPAGWVEGLQPYVSDTSKTTPDFQIADFFPNTVKNDSWDGTPGDAPGTRDAKRWAHAWGWEINVLCYRQDILMKHGLTVPRTYAPPTASSRASSARHR